MTDRRRPFDPSELEDAPASELAAARVAARLLERTVNEPTVAPGGTFVDRVMAAVATEPLPEPTTAARHAVRDVRPLGLIAALRDAVRVTFSGGRPYAVRLSAAPLATVALLLALGGGSLIVVGAAQLLPHPSSTDPLPSVPVTPPAPSDTPSAPVPSPSSAATPPPTNTSAPTATPRPTRTASPTPAGTTATPRPTATGAATAMPMATGTETPGPSRTPRPNGTPKPNQTPKPNETSKPTSTSGGGGSGSDGSGSSGSGSSGSGASDTSSPTETPSGS